MTTPLTPTTAQGADTRRYYIASLKHTNKGHEHITFWGPAWRGYVLAIVDGHVGEYDEVEAALELNDGESCIAVPADAVKALLSPEPYFANGHGKVHRFYDTRGPVVDNTRANWNALIKASLQAGRRFKPKPEVHRGARRSFALPESTYA